MLEEIKYQKKAEINIMNKKPIEKTKNKGKRQP